MPRRTDASPSDEFPDDLILAAIDRAIRHRSGRSVPYWVLFDHLAVRSRSKQARHVRARLTALSENGSITQSREHGVQVWALTSKGKRRVRRASKTADLLPESPQHQEWRSARTAAGDSIEEFHKRLQETLTEAMSALAAPDTTSDDWFALKDRLEGDARRLAATTYCLREWPEPDDARADVDELTSPADEGLSAQERKHREGRRVGRRNPLLWLNPDAGPPELD